MAKNIYAYRGCLLGLAVGDAMGYTVDRKSLAEIQEDYGPNGLLGYDLLNGYADVSSYTQLAAFTCNGLLLGLTQGRLSGKMKPFVRYIGLSHREWAASQRVWGRPDKTFCWLLQRREICRRNCMDTMMVENILRGRIGTMEEPVNHLSDPYAITAAAAVGMFFDPENMDQAEFDRLGAETVALTQGNPMAFLPGAVVTHLVSAVLADREKPLEELVEDALNALNNQFAREYESQVSQICALVRQAMALAEDPALTPMEAMERLKCENGAQVLAGAVYAMLVGREDFDAAMITAVNHSGRSSAVGAVTGAVLGARMGQDALPNFYLDCLEPADILADLADDLFQGCPLEKGDIFYDDDWERKYLRGGR